MTKTATQVNVKSDKEKLSAISILDETAINVANAIADKEGVKAFVAENTKKAAIRLRCLDLAIVESEVRELQATAYCGDLVLSFMHGKLTPISRRNQTKKII